MLKLLLLLLTIHSFIRTSGAEKTLANNQYALISDTNTMAVNPTSTTSQNTSIIASDTRDTVAAEKVETVTPISDTVEANAANKTPRDQNVASNRFIAFLKNLFGLLLILAGIVLLWFNEKKAIEMARIINFGEKACEEIHADQYDSELNGELIHITGKVSTPNTLHDQGFGIEIKDAVKLKRVVQLYQFRELKTAKNGSIQYEKVWCDYSIPSLAFLEDSMRQSNDKAKFITYKMVFTAENVHLGNYRLTPYQTERLDNWIPLQLGGSSRITFSRDTKDRIHNLGWERQVIDVNDNNIMIKQGESEDPQIGDIKISFYQLPCDVVTVISEQAGISFRPYNIKEKRFIKKSEAEKERLLDEEEQRFDQALERSIDKCCWGMFCCWLDNTPRNPLRSRETIDWIYPGRISKKDFFTSQIKVESRHRTNITRVICVAILTLGLCITFNAVLNKLVVVKKLNEITSSAPLISNIGFAVLGAVLISGFAWIFYRRWFGMGIVLCAASIIGIIYVCQELALV